MSGFARGVAPVGQSILVSVRPRVDPFDPQIQAHLWVVATVFRVIPEHWYDPDNTPHLDGENLIQVAGPFCYHCEHVYEPSLATRPCHPYPPGDD